MLEGVMVMLVEVIFKAPLANWHGLCGVNAAVDRCGITVLARYSLVPSARIATARAASFIGRR
jgi:hypothetical protein